MQIVLNHVTRMGSPRICIAGVDPSGKHVRPTTVREEPITRDLLAVERGFVEPGVLVDIGDAVPQPVVPEVEDHRCSLDAIRAVRRLDADSYLDVLDRVARDDLEEIFGPDVYRPSTWKYAVDEGRGAASLGVLRVSRRPEVMVDRFDGDRAAVRLNDVDPPAFVRITDVRFFDGDQVTLRTDVVEDVDARLAEGVDAFLMLGLSRALLGRDGHYRHWLQVNGVCLQDRPLGDRP